MEILIKTWCKCNHLYGASFCCLQQRPTFGKKYSVMDLFLIGFLFFYQILHWDYSFNINEVVVKSYRQKLAGLYTGTKVTVF